MINELANDYAAYVKCDLGKKLAPVEETIEDMLTRLEEFESLADMVRNDSSYNVSVPQQNLLQCKEEINLLCSRVDKLETFVNRVRQDLDTLEAHMDAAEAEMGSVDGKLKNILKPLFSKKPEHPILRSPKLPDYKAPQLFSTENYFSDTPPNT